MFLSFGGYTNIEICLNVHNTSTYSMNIRIRITLNEYIIISRSIEFIIIYNKGEKYLKTE